MSNHRLLLANALLALTLLGSCWGRGSESASPPREFLQRLSLPYRGWKAREAALTPSEVSLLEPDAVLLRRYAAPDGDTVELAVIAGHRKRSVHTPGYCLAGDGWEVLSRSRGVLSLPGRAVPATQELLARDRTRMMATYFFTDGEYVSDAILPFQAHQLLRRFSGGFPLGALVRILVPVRGDAAAASLRTGDFARATLPSVLDALRGARAAAR